MDQGQTFFEPLDVAVYPRFSGIATFMRLPHVADPAQLDVALIGVPWDAGVTNRPGARHGPRAMRDASGMMRRVNHQTRVCPYELARIADLGDVSVNPCDLDETMGRVERFFRGVRDGGAIPLTAGGDHMITLPILRGLVGGGVPVGLVHFDAHSDTTDSYFGGAKLTHGTPFRRAIEEGLLDPKRMIQVGIRGSMFDLHDLDFAIEAGVRIMFIEEAMDLGPAGVTAEIRRVVGEAPCYLTFDIDSLDPVYAPGTGTPEAGGFTTFQAQQMLRGLRGLNYVGGDVVEVAPPFDPSGNTALVGATMMFEILCLLAETVGARRGRLPGVPS
ncbi:MAG TPA: agmatinase [Azospirillum sp.]|nr:agmatinase [Azospirillum sp.]